MPVLAKPSSYVRDYTLAKCSLKQESRRRCFLDANRKTWQSEQPASLRVWCASAESSRYEMTTPTKSIRHPEYNHLGIRRATMISVALLFGGRDHAEPAIRPFTWRSMFFALPILNAPAKHGTQGGDRPKVEELSFIQTGPVRDSATRRDHAVVRARWQHANQYADLFAVTESCDNKTFVLEQSDSRERQADTGASGNSDHVVVVTLKQVAGRKGDEFTFEERLGLSIHARAPDSASRGGYAIPPIRFTGSAGRAEDGSWIARVKKAIFAS